MNHKIHIYGVTYHARWLGGPRPPATVWYVSCECDWAPDTMVRHADGVPRYGRPTWDAAFALGVAHQKEAKDSCDCE